jgi:hypothetical protein
VELKVRADLISKLEDMTQNGKVFMATANAKNNGSDSAKEFRKKMAKTRGEVEAALRRSGEALAEADAALKIGSR